jgi:hypothetical protein
VQRTTKAFLWAGSSIALFGGIFFAAAIVYRDPGPPPIARDLFPDQRAEEDVGNSARFDALVQRRFLLGSQEAALISVLGTQGFGPYANNIPIACASDAGRHTAVCGPRHFVYEFGTSSCVAQLAVDWTVDGSKRLTGVKGSYEYVCL